MGVSGGHAIGTTGGAETTTLSTANLASHSHGVTDPGHTHVFTGTAHNHGVTDPQHTHTVTDPGHTHAPISGLFMTSNPAAFLNIAAGVTADEQATTASATTGITNQNASTGVSVNNTTAAGTNASNTTGLTTNSAGSGTAATTVSPFGTAFAIIKT